MQTKSVVQFENITKKVGNKTIMTFDINQGDVKTTINENSIEIVIDTEQFSEIINKFVLGALNVLATETATKMFEDKFLELTGSNNIVTRPVVQFKNITKRIGDKTIIDQITFDINEGEVFGFLGPNGAGKTTTIRMLFGLISITEGEIIINGRNIKDDFEAAISKVGGIIENPEMYKYLTGYENLAQAANMYENIPKERINEVIELVGLDKRVHDKVGTYSLGMRQRLGLAQALLHKPNLIVLDEPTNGLDPAGIHELRGYLRNLAEKENIAVLISSHQLNEMELMCDRVGVIQKGNLVTIQKMSELLKQDKASRVIFTVDNVSKAKLCLENMFRDQETVVHGNSIDIVIDSDQFSEIINQFVQEKIKVIATETATKTLEDKFLELTGGHEIE